MAFNFLSWLHFAYFCSKELCIILGIYRFSLKKRADEKVQLKESEEANEEEGNERKETNEPNEERITTVTNTSELDS